MKKILFLILVSLAIIIPVVSYAEIDCDDLGTPNDMHDTDCGGTNIDTSASSGIPKVTAGTWSIDATCADMTTTDCGAVTGTDITASSSFTSPGIDDNADAIAITIDSDEKILHGTTTSIAAGSLEPDFQMHGTSNVNASIGGTRWGGTSPGNGTWWYMNRSRGTSVGSYAAVAPGDTIGAYIWNGDDGDSFSNVGRVYVTVDSAGTVADNQVPGYLQLQTSNASGNLTTGIAIDMLQQVFMSAVYNDDLNGDTYRPLLIKDDGQLGYDSAPSTLVNQTPDTDPTGDDLAYTVNDPGGTPGDRKVTLANLGKGITDNRPLNILWATPTDSVSYPFMKAKRALTITDIDCIIDPADTGESVVIDIRECNSTADSCVTVDATITCDNDGAADDGSFSNGAIDAGDWLLFDIGTVTGTVSSLAVTIYYDDTVQ